MYAKTAKKRTFHCHEENNKAFEYLKNRLTNPPLLAFFAFKSPLVVETDSSVIPLGLVLAQN